MGTQQIPAPSVSAIKYSKSKLLACTGLHNCTFVGVVRVGFSACVLVDLHGGCARSAVVKIT